MMLNRSLPVADALSDAAYELSVRLRAGSVLVLAESGAGSGTAWGSNELIVTNSHVVQGTRARIAIGESAHEADVIARDQDADLVLLRCEPIPLLPLPIRTEAVRVGELAYAIGNPWGERNVVTAGAVLAPGGPGLDGRSFRPVRADVRLAPGNSGGPMTDARGQVIGINSMVVGGLAVAIPAVAVERFVAGAVRVRPRAA